MEYLISIDQGTTGTTAVLVELETMKFIDKENLEFPQIMPSPGLVEHNLNDIWNTVEKTVTAVLLRNKVPKDSIKGIGITNQRETTCAFDLNGKPLSNAIVWQDKRTLDFCKSLKDKGLEELVKKKTGLTIDPYFSGTKMNWLLANNENVKKAASEKNLRFGTIDTFLLYKLSGNSSFATEGSNASRTLLMDLESVSWDDELLSIFGIDKDFLPKINSSFTEFGTTKGLSFLPDGVPISGILGDQQAALFGQNGINKGDAKCTYGTGAFMLLNTGKEIKYSKNGLLTTIAYVDKDGPVYAIEGSSFIAGAAVQWLRDNLNLFEESPEVEDFANKVDDLNQMKNILFFPFFTGLGSPYWKPEGLGAIIGLSRDTNKFHISRAALEGITLSINDLIRSFSEDFNSSLKELKVDGGATANSLLMTMQASFSNLEVVRPKVIETTAYGAALACAIGINAFNKEDIYKLWDEEKRFFPDEKNIQYYKDKEKMWEKVLNRNYLS